MSQQFLLICECGNEFPILPRHAGESRDCKCGTTVVVPTLRDIRRLPRYEGESAQQDGEKKHAGKPGKKWTIGHGIAFSLGVPIILLSLGWFGYNAWQRNRINTDAPTPDDILAASSGILASVDFDDLSLVDSYEQVWKPLRDLSIQTRPMPGYVARRKYAAGLGKNMGIAAIAAGIGFLAVAWSLLSSRAAFS